MDKSRIYTFLAVGFAFLQTLFSGDVTMTIIFLTLASVFTILKQRVSIEVNENAMIATYVLVALAVMGGLNDLLGVFHFGEVWDVRLRKIVAALIGLLNIASKNLFPTEEGKVIQGVKQELKEAK